MKNETTSSLFSSKIGERNETDEEIGMKQGY